MTQTLSLAAPRSISSTAGDATLKAAARLWLLVAVIGQWAFLYYIVAFYGSPTLTGHFEAWRRNTMLFKGYVAGDTAGNLSFAAHVLLAAVIAFGGALQLIPWIRSRVPAVHRWNGRLFMLTALGVSLSGLYMIWVRGGNPTLVGDLAISGDALLIIAFAALAWSAARARDIPAHRRWALRLYLVANGQWFFRVGLFAWIMVNRGPVGVGKNLDGPFALFWDFACYLLPLAVLELYLRAKEGAGPGRRFAVAGGLAILTVLTGVGIFGVYMAMWRPLLGRA
ncbi:MAG: DUF2306 domain-containing protein [Pseudomonadota bacterium]|nr:DUF2306 domain-containing protein [Pseudomonadota bacterium]